MKPASISSPRLKRLASQLSSIQISLDPPSPTLQCSPSPNDFMSWTTPQVNTVNSFLRVPGADLSIDQPPGFSSPPPDRRYSFASTVGDTSTMTISLSGSYQNLQFPSWKCLKYQSYSYDSDTPLSEYPRPHSAQVSYLLHD
uniref:RunxI domain-containing protein n=1 Tax=Ascaris lumbricoides TaxID=6252 RepID=A0A0M3I4B4_ASCLU